MDHLAITVEAFIILPLLLLDYTMAVAGDEDAIGERPTTSSDLRT